MLKRASLPALPKAPDLEVKAQHDSATRTDLPVPQVSVRRATRAKPNRLYLIVMLLAVLVVAVVLALLLVKS